MKYYNTRAQKSYRSLAFSLTGTVAMATLPVKLSFKEDTTPEWCVTGNLIQKMVRINSVPLSTWNCSLDPHNLVKRCVGLPAPSNSSLATFDLQYSAAEGTMFDNWHYPISCVHRKDLAPYWSISTTLGASFISRAHDHARTQWLILSQAAQPADNCSANIPVCESRPLIPRYL